MFGNHDIAYVEGFSSPCINDRKECTGVKDYREAVKGRWHWVVEVNDRVM